MLEGIIYFIVIIFSSGVGAISGMSGGVIMKPIFDALAFHSVSAISFYAGIAIFTMSIVASIKQISGGTHIDLAPAVTISMGSIIGGFLGNVALEHLISIYENDEIVNLIQIGLSIAALLFVLIAMRDGVKTYNVQKLVWYFLSGLGLGFLASLLGIGGGPINVALLTLAFSVPIKKATTFSLVIIFFSQLSRLISVPFTTGFGVFDLTMLYWIIPAALLGGFMGSKLKNMFSEERILKTFKIVVIGVICLNAMNGINLLFF